MDETLTMDTVLRRYADDIARAIRADGVVASCGESIEVIVEDRAEIENAIKTAITKATGGVAVLVTVVRWRRRANTGRLMTGDIDFQISVHENPLFNRKGQFVLTAQCVAERIAVLLHWRRLADAEGREYDSRIVVDDIVRSDDKTANIEVISAHTEQRLRGDTQE